MAVAVAQPVERPDLYRALARHQRAFDQNILGLAPIGPGVHLHRAAHGAGYAAQELKPGDARVPRRRSNRDSHGGATGADAVARLHRHLCERLGKPDHRSEEHTSELQSLMRISYAVFCLKKKKTTYTLHNTISDLAAISKSDSNAHRQNM